MGLVVPSVVSVGHMPGGCGCPHCGIMKKRKEDGGSINCMKQFHQTCAKLQLLHDYFLAKHSKLSFSGRKCAGHAKRKMNIYLVHRHLKHHRF